MADRGRAPGFKMPDEHRVKIANSNILSYLIQHAEGEREMSQSQVTTGIALLRKVLPDLAVTTIQGDGEGGALKVIIQSTDADL